MFSHLIHDRRHSDLEFPATGGENTEFAGLGGIVASLDEDFAFVARGKGSEDIVDAVNGEDDDVQAVGAEEGGHQGGLGEVEA